MGNALGILGQLRADTGRRAVFVCGDMAELGERERALHEQLGEAIVDAGGSVVIGVGRYGAAVEAGIRSAGGTEAAVRCFSDVEAACNNLAEFVQDYDIVLVKGSRCVGLERAVETLRGLFS